MSDVDANRVLAGGGEMGALMRSTAWAQTAIGPVEGWSPALRATVGLLLRNRSALLLWWGPQFVQLYNDAYRPVLGDKHPRSMGQPVSECWHEIWHIIGPMIEAPYRGEPATTSDDLFVLVNRRGFVEETHFRVAYSPVPDETVEGTGVGGVLATVAETRAYQAERQRADALAAIVSHEFRTVEREESSFHVAHGPHRSRLLVADDNADMREYLRRILQDHWEVVTVADGGSALHAIMERIPDLVLTDVMMPVLDGFRLLKVLRDNPSTKHLPVIMLSARAGEEARVEGLEAGADDYLVKPFSARELVARVRTHLELARFRRHMHEQHEHAYALFMQSPVPICVFHGEDLVFEMANEAMLALLGHRNIVGARYFDVYPELGGQRFDKLILEVMRTGKGFVGEEMLATFDRRGNGHVEDTYWTVSYAPLRNPVGSCDRVMVAATDVTHQVLARRKIEAERQSARAAQAQAEAAVGARDEFFTVASHELRTPLTTLGLQLDGLLRGLKEHFAEGGSERLIRKAERVREQTDRLEDLIERMMNTFNASRPTVDIVYESVDLADVARLVVERFLPESKRAQAAIELSAQSVVGYWDRRTLDQIMTQLIANALKFGAGKTVNVVIESSDDLARLTVIDRGIGIAPEHHERIFERFERATSADNYGGFGLGLWIVRKLVNEMGGTVGVQSEPGRGSTFVVELPRRR